MKKNKKIKLIKIFNITILRIETYNKEKRIQNKKNKLEAKANKLNKRLEVIKLKNEIK